MSGRHLRCAGSSPGQCSKNPHCAWQSDPPACVLELDTVGRWLDAVCEKDRDDDTTIVLDALMSDLAAFGIETKENHTGNPCRRAVVGLLTHFMLRNEAIDPDAVQEVIRKWSGRLLPGFVLRPFGYRQTLQDLLDDVDVFVGRLMSDLSDRGELALPSRILSEGQVDIRRAVGRHGSSRTGKLLAAGGLLALLVMLASSHVSSDQDTEAPIPVVEERVASVFESFPDSVAEEELEGFVQEEKEDRVDRLPTLDELIDSLPDTDIESLVLASELPVMSDRPRDLEFKEIALGAAGLAGLWKVGQRALRPKKTVSPWTEPQSPVRNEHAPNQPENAQKQYFSEWLGRQDPKTQTEARKLFAKFNPHNPQDMKDLQSLADKVKKDSWWVTQFN